MLMADECAESGFNDEDAYAIETAVVRTASAFIRALPAGVPLPEISPAPDGSIIFDWTLSKRRVFSLSIGETDRLAYACFGLQRPEPNDFVLQDSGRGVQGRWRLDRRVR